MPRIRILIVGLPLLLTAITLVALWTVARVSVDKKNEIFIGSIGEPSTLNPIQAADSASSSVTGMIFNGLLKYNADLEITGDLATDWDLSQRSTFFFSSAEEALQAAASMESQLVDREAFHLQHYEVRDNRLTLELSLPGVADSRALAALFGASRPRPVGTLSVVAPQSLGDALARFAAVDLAAEVVRVWAHQSL